MRVMGLLKADKESEAGVPPSPELMERCGKFIEEITKAGVLVASDGLQPSSKGKRVRLADNKVTVIDGPFAETKELIASYALLEVKSMAEAVEWTTRFLECLGGGECEIRPLFEAHDFDGGSVCSDERGANLRTNAETFTVATPTDREIVMTRVFDAPCKSVFEALTKPELVKRWLLGPPGWTMPVCEIDARVGGAYRYVWRNAEGTEMGLGGVFREIVPPQRLVVTEKWDQPWYPGEAIVTNALIEGDSKTTLTLTVRYDSREARDGVLSSGMEQGVAASYDRLAELLAGTTQDT